MGRSGRCEYRVRVCVCAIYRARMWVCMRATVGLEILVVLGYIVGHADAQHIYTHTYTCLHTLACCLLQVLN